MKHLTLVPDQRKSMKHRILMPDQRKSMNHYPNSIQASWPSSVLRVSASMVGVIAKGYGNDPKAPY